MCGFKFERMYKIALVWQRHRVQVDPLKMSNENLTSLTLTQSEII